VKGQFYGTTVIGGTTGLCPDVNSPGCGTVFQLTPPSAPGGAPQSPIFDRAGNLYGSAVWGKYGFGMIFTLQPSTTNRGSWVESAVYNLVKGRK
jgi:hypothetical protein